ncbi:MAG: hypothetical protein E7347_04550 [Clostridiales bacterium]|nr:hypothetical protein [Clostridiales bacterium]
MNNQENKQKYEETKKNKNSYKNDIYTAYGIGYVKGWDDSYHIPDRFGAKTAAAYGYKKGIKNHRKSDKYTNQYNKNKK